MGNLENHFSTSLSNWSSYDKSMLNRCVWAVKLFIIELTNSRRYVEHIISISENEQEAINTLIHKRQIDYLGECPHLFASTYHPYIADELIKQEKIGLLLEKLDDYKKLSYEHAEKIISFYLMWGYNEDVIKSNIKNHITSFDKKERPLILDSL